MLFLPGYPWVMALTPKHPLSWSEELILSGLISILTVTMTAYLLRELLFEEINNSLIILATLIPALLGWVIQLVIKRIVHE
jgi:uncharacterized membrane protein